MDDAQLVVDGLGCSRYVLDGRQTVQMPAACKPEGESSSWHPLRPCRSG
ncbi:hypothetical protein ACQ86D_51160 [Streptomyces galilaeus]